MISEAIHLTINENDPKQKKILYQVMEKIRIAVAKKGFESIPYQDIDLGDIDLGDIDIMPYMEFIKNAGYFKMNSLSFDVKDYGKKVFGNGSRKVGY